MLHQEPKKCFPSDVFKQIIFAQELYRDVHVVRITKISRLLLDERIYVRQTVRLRWAYGVDTNILGFLGIPNKRSAELKNDNLNWEFIGGPHS